MDVEVLEDNVPVEAIVEEMKSVLRMLNILESNVTQVGLQSPKSDYDQLNDWKLSIGRLSSVKYPETYFKHCMYDTPITNKYMNKYGLVRTRLMCSRPKTCLTIHQDMTKRIHIPLVSNEHCKMMIDDRTYYLEPGKVYLTDTTKFHTSFNGSLKNRFHIMGCVYQ